MRPHLDAEGRRHRAIATKGAAAADAAPRAEAAQRRVAATRWTALDRLEHRLIVATILQLVVGLLGNDAPVYDFFLTALIVWIALLIVAALAEEEGVECRCIPVSGGGDALPDVAARRSAPRNAHAAQRVPN